MTSVGIAWAWTSSASNPGTQVAAATIGTPASLTAMPNPDPPLPRCNDVTLDWTAAAWADARRIEVRTAKTSFSELVASHPTTSYVDPTNRRNFTVTYRVTPLLTGTTWEGTPSQVELTCGIGQVDDLVAVNDCNDTVVTWSAPENANNYDVQRRINPAGWTTIATNHVGTSYTDTTVHPPGTNVRYRVRPGDGATNGRNSNVSVIASWDSFRVVSVDFANGGIANTRDAGDTITVTFSKPVDLASMTTSTVVVKRNGNPRGVFIPATAANAASTEAGWISTSNNFFGANATLAGSTAWSAGDTVWTWTSTSGGTGPSMSQDIAGTPGAGTAAARARCGADGTSTLVGGGVTPTLTGRW